MAKHAFFWTCRSLRTMEVIFFGPGERLVSGLLLVGTWFCDLKDLGHHGRASSHERGWFHCWSGLHRWKSKPLVGKTESPRSMLRSKKECQMVLFAMSVAADLWWTRLIWRSFDALKSLPVGAFETAPRDSDLPHQPKSLLWTCFKNNEVCGSLARLVLKSWVFFIIMKPTCAELSYFLGPNCPCYFLSVCP